MYQSSTGHLLVFPGNRTAGTDDLFENAGEGAPRAQEVPVATTRGVLYVHTVPSALCPHVEWAAGGILGVPVKLDWTPQPAAQGTYRAELSWQAEAGTAAKLASALRGWQKLRFEVTVEPSKASRASDTRSRPSSGSSTRPPASTATSWCRKSG